MSESANVEKVRSLVEPIGRPPSDLYDLSTAAASCGSRWTRRLAARGVNLTPSPWLPGSSAASDHHDPVPGHYTLEVTSRV